MFAYSCPGCHQRLTAAPERTGQKTTCPKCFEQFSIPRPSQMDMEEIIDGDGGIDLDGVAFAANDALDLDFADPYSSSILGHDSQDERDDEDVDLSLSDMRPISAPPMEAQTPAPKHRPVYAGSSATPSRGMNVNGSSMAPLPAMRRQQPMPLVRDRGLVSLEPTGLAAVDVAAELTAALTMRMKPPPDPPADLALTTGGWLLMCGAAAVAWMAGVFFQADALPFVAVIGALMVAFAYFWCAYLAGRNNRRRGLLTLLPPVNLWRIAQPFGDNAYRPLRFALTGLLCLAMYWVGLPARAGMRSIYNAFEFDRSATAAEPDPMHLSIRKLVEEKKWDDVLTHLVNLTLPEYRNDIAEQDKPALTAELVRLTKPLNCERSDVRMKSLACLLLWSPTDGREAMLTALTSGELFERRHAVSLAHHWPNDGTAIAVARRMIYRSEEADARAALLLLPPEVAETGLLPLLKSEDLILVLTVGELLEKIGGPRSVEALTALSRASINKASREELQRMAEAIETRLKAKK